MRNPVPDGLSVSVLIATCGRRDLLLRSLRALALETKEKPEQIVVVIGRADGSLEASRNLLAEAREIRVEQLSIENRSLGDSQNRGLPFCTGDIVATLDDDAFVCPDWVTEVKRSHLEHPEAGCIGGRILNYFPDNRIARFESEVGLPYDLDEGHYARTVAGVSCTYKRKVMEEVGEFDESLPAGMDVDYNWRIQKAGYRVWFEPRIRLYHMNRTELGPFLRQMTWYGRGYYRTRRKHPDLPSAMPRNLRRWQEWAKLFWTGPAIVWDAARLLLTSPRDRVAFAGLMFLKGLYWRKGWLQEMFRSQGG